MQVQVPSPFAFKICNNCLDVLEKVVHGSLTQLSVDLIELIRGRQVKSLGTYTYFNFVW